MKPENIELRIEELVLRGFAPGDRYGIGGAVARELTHLLEADGSLPWLDQGDHDQLVLRVDAGSFEVGATATPGAVGASIARVLHRGLSASGSASAPGAEAR